MLERISKYFRLKKIVVATGGGPSLEFLDYYTRLIDMEKGSEGK